MESADPIIDADDVARWWDVGLRVVGPAHFGHNTYIHGTFTEGGLKPPAKPLYEAMRQAGMILDITHMADQAVWESFELWDGPIMASHCTCHSIVPGQRHLTDDMIGELIRRDGIIGLVVCQFFIDPDIQWETRPARHSWDSKYGMEGLLPHVERIADLQRFSSRPAYLPPTSTPFSMETRCGFFAAPGVDATRRPDDRTAEMSVWIRSIQPEAQPSVSSDCSNALM